MVRPSRANGQNRLARFTVVVVTSASPLREPNLGVQVVAFFLSLAFAFPVEPSIILNKRLLLRDCKNKKAHFQITKAVRDDWTWHVPMCHKYFFSVAFFVKLIVNEFLTAYQVACLKNWFKWCSVLILNHWLCELKNTFDLAFKAVERCVKNVSLKSETKWIERLDYNLEEWIRGALSGFTLR